MVNVNIYLILFNCTCWGQNWICIWYYSFIDRKIEYVFDIRFIMMVKFEYVFDISPMLMVIKLNSIDILHMLIVNLNMNLIWVIYLWYNLIKVVYVILS
jgi:hypothetical protein